MIPKIYLVMLFLLIVVIGLVRGPEGFIDRLYLSGLKMFQLLKRYDK